MQQTNKPTLKKFSNWLSKELSAGNFTQIECEAMYQDFSQMPESRLKRLSINFNL